MRPRKREKRKRGHSTFSPPAAGKSKGTFNFFVSFRGQTRVRLEVGSPETARPQP